MAGFADGRFAATQEQQRKFYDKHIAPWMGRMFADLEKSETAKFYKTVGALGRLFMEIESEAFKFAN
jgi:TorA maturation chaperone TorD